MKNYLSALLLFLAGSPLAAQTDFSALWTRPAWTRPTWTQPQRQSVCAAAQPAQGHVASAEFKSKSKAFFLSLLAPGLGEYYAGRTRRAQVFFTTEIALWLAYAGFKTYENWRIEDYRGYAAENAGVNLKGKNNSYFIDIGNYNHIDEYNEAKLRQRYLNAYYRDVTGYYWSWPSDEQRMKYKNLRLSAERANQHALFGIGAVVVNHLFSAIDAVWSTHQYNKNHRTGVGFHFNLGCTPTHIQLSLNADWR
ncbi:MAG TPA: hypothetical protein PK843_03130 [bacterium]|nr:hypothetical protein [bacterium]HPN33477.1 hypothetical protein [bacterium]